MTAVLKPERRADRSPSVSPVSPALWVAALTSALAGLIHYTVVPEHLSEWWLYAAFFTLLGMFELVWAALVLTGGERPLLMLGLVVNVLVLALWTVTRTSGLPFGHFAWQPEDIGLPDVVCCLAEATTVGAVISAWLTGRARRDPPAAAQAGLAHDRPASA